MNSKYHYIIKSIHKMSIQELSELLLGQKKWILHKKNDKKMYEVRLNPNKIQDTNIFLFYWIDQLFHLSLQIANFLSHLFHHSWGWALVCINSWYNP